MSKTSNKSLKSEQTDRLEETEATEEAETVEETQPAEPPQLLEQADRSGLFPRVAVLGLFATGSVFYFGLLATALGVGSLVGAVTIVAKPLKKAIVDKGYGILDNGYKNPHLKKRFRLAVGTAILGLTLAFGAAVNHSIFKGELSFLTQLFNDNTPVSNQHQRLTRQKAPEV